MNILVSMGVNVGTTSAKLKPLSSLELVKNIYVLSKSKGPTINSKVKYKKHPKFIIYNKIISFLILPFIIIWNIRKYKIDVILSYHIIPHAIFAVFCGKLCNIKIISSQTGSSIKQIVNKKFVGKVILEFVKQVDFLAVPGENSKNFWINNELDSKKILKLHSTIDTNKFKKREKKVLFDFLYIGRFAKEKQLNKLISIFKRIHLKRPSIRLLMIGFGPEKDYLISKIKALNLSNSIKLLGYRRDPSIYYNISKYFILTSKSEGLSTSMLEAMSSGLPPIVPNTGDLGEVVKSKYNGLLYNSVDHSNLPYEIIKFIDKTNYVNMSNNAINSVQKGHSFFEAKRKWTKLFEKLNIQ